MHTPALTGSPARTLLVPLLLASLLAACGSSEVRKKEAPPRPDSGAPGSAPGPGAPVPAPKMSEMERARFYFDLDQDMQRYMTARDEGNSAVWTGLHTGVLRPMADRNLDELLRTVGDRKERAYRTIAARALGFGSRAERTVPALAGVLGEADLSLVSSALVSLYLLKSPATPLSPLTKLLSHADADVRSNAALALYAVLRARRGEKDRVELTPEVKAAAGRLLVAVSDPRDPFVRAHAAAALGVIGDPAAADVLVNLLGDGEAAVRARAAEGLGQLGREQAVPALIDALGRATLPTEKKVIQAALEKIARRRGFPCDVEALGEDPTRWRAWYMSLKK